jgi:hypothetical protein
VFFAMVVLVLMRTYRDGLAPLAVRVWHVAREWRTRLAAG